MHHQIPFGGRPVVIRVNGDFPRPWFVCAISVSEKHSDPWKRYTGDALPENSRIANSVKASAEKCAGHSSAEEFDMQTRFGRTTASSVLSTPSSLLMWG